MENGQAAAFGAGGGAVSMPYRPMITGPLASDTVTTVSAAVPGRARYITTSVRTAIGSSISAPGDPEAMMGDYATPPDIILSGEMRRRVHRAVVRRTMRLNADVHPSTISKRICTFPFRNEGRGRP